MTESWPIRADGRRGDIADEWYGGYSVPSATGLMVSADRAMRLSAVFACVRRISSSRASLPCFTYKWLPDGGKQLAPQRPIFGLLQSRPNSWQTSFEFLEMQQAH